MRFSGNKLFSVNLFCILEISLCYLLHLCPLLSGAFEGQQFLECTSLLSALQSWFLPMSSVCCDSPSLPFCQSARALWRFLNPPNNNRPLKKPLGFCANQVAQPRTLTYLSLGSSASGSCPTYLHYFENDQKSIAFRSICLSIFEEMAAILNIVKSENSEMVNIGYIFIVQAH